jgi:glutathione S-transferase
MPITLEYWAVRGTGHHVRCMAFFLGLEITDTRLGMEDAEVYFGKKHSLAAQGNSLVNMPSITDGDVYVSEASACIVYLLEKAGRQDMMNTTWQREQANSIVTSVYGAVTKPCYAATDKDALVVTLEPVFAGFAKFQMPGLAARLGDKPFLFGDQPVAVDFQLADLLEKVNAMDNELTMETKLVKGNATWEGYLARFKALDKIAAFRASDKYLERPYNSPMAKWF